MPEQRHAESTGRCSDPACRYRQLYEGSQTSLADMASKQASALRSNTAMKRRISDLIKQHFPDVHNRAERSLGHRFTDASDEVILTYLEQLVSEAISPLSPATERSGGAGSELLRAALRRAGYPVGDDADLSAWAAIVDRTEPSRAAAPAVAAAPAPAAPAPTPEDELDDLFVTPAPRPQPAAEPALEELFGDDEPSAPAPAPDPHPASSPGFDDPLGLDDLFDDGFQTPAVPATSTPAGAGPSGGLDDLFGDDAAPLAPSSSPADDLDDLFGDDVAAPAAVDAPAEEAVGLDDLFGDDTASTTEQSGGLDDLFGDDEPATAPAVGLDDLFGGYEPSAPAAAPEPAPEPQAASAAKGGWSAPPDAEALTVPIRPELVPGRTRKRAQRTPRTPRTRADRPDPSRDLDQGEDVADVEPDVASRIAAAVAIPRPMFNSDLVSVAGDREQLDAWSQEMLNLGAVAPVRFVVAKARHRALGPLVLPHGELRAAATEFDSSWWAQVMDKYHGTALYELAVLLSRVGDQVQATDLWDTAARFRLDTPRGLVGLVVHLSGGLNEGDLGRTELDEALAGFSRERFTLVAVLNVVANPAALDQLAECVGELAEAHAWRPAYPVVATHTWEWAANSGRTARLVLGG